MDIYVPIASQNGYRELCVAPARKLGLIWIPLFETGCPVPPESIAEVMAEFATLQLEMRGDPDKDRFVNQLDRVIDELRECEGRTDVEVWIG